MSYTAPAMRAWAGLDQPPGILLAYPLHTTSNVAELVAPFREIGCRVFADSGAWSAWASGATVELDGYCEWLNQWRHLIDLYANLDVIGSSTDTLANYQTMTQRGFRPLNVVSPATPKDHIAAVPPTDPVALGGLTRLGRKKENRARWIRATSTALGPTHPELHLFGVSEIPLFSSAKMVRSIDSTTWMAGFKYGRLVMWRPRRGLLQQHGVHLVEKDRTIQEDLETLGFSWRRVVSAMHRRDSDLVAQVALASLAVAQTRLDADRPHPFTIYAAAIV